LQDLSVKAAEAIVERAHSRIEQLNKMAAVTHRPAKEVERAKQQCERLLPMMSILNGYVPVRNDADKSDDQWKFGGSRSRSTPEKPCNERLRSAAKLISANY
jgi:hypothetical protein